MLVILAPGLGAPVSRNTLGRGADAPRSASGVTLTSNEVKARRGRSRRRDYAVALALLGAFAGTLAATVTASMPPLRPYHQFTSGTAMNSVE